MMLITPIIAAIGYSLLYLLLGGGLGGALLIFLIAKMLRK
jgi:Na+(H+)/acetate symporter ActP